MLIGQYCSSLGDEASGPLKFRVREEWAHEKHNVEKWPKRRSMMKPSWRPSPMLLRRTSLGCIRWAQHLWFKQELMLDSILWLIYLGPQQGCYRAWFSHLFTLLSTVKNFILRLAPLLPVESSNVRSHPLKEIFPFS